MSEPSGPQGKSGPGKPPDGRRGADAALEGADLDFEPDALLDTLLADPFPSAQGTPTARPPKPIPFETDSLHAFESEICCDARTFLWPCNPNHAVTCEVSSEFCEVSCKYSFR